MNKQIFASALIAMVAQATDYTYGSACSTNHDQDCAINPGCSSCKWSWPSDDPAQWGSSNAKCRCESCDGQPCPEPSADDYAYGNDCGSLDAQDCANDPGCTSCNWSWPALDPAQWSSADAKCRCKTGSDGSPSPSPSPDTRDNYEYGNDCSTLQDDHCDDVSDCNKCAWSWPKNQDWSSPSAACRCQSTDSNPYPIPDPADYEFGDDCDTLQSQDCSLVDCIQCSWSWPKSDPTGWDGADARCRCEYKQGDVIPDARDPPLKVQVDGVETQLYVTYPKWWSEATTDGDKELNFDYNNRMYLATSREEDAESVDPTKYFKPNMLGGSMEYDVNLSQVGCGCVTALYTILMPSVDENVDPWKYCDAQGVGGYLCPEFDIMEANQYAFHTTAHKCDAPDMFGNYHSCDRSGTCTSNMLDNVSSGPHPDYMPGSTSGINTDQEFHVKIDFHEADSQFSGYTLTMTQGTKVVTYNKSDCAYLNAMTSDVQQMVFAISNWSTDDISWLQKDSCSGTCSAVDTQNSFKNLSFTTAGSPPNPDPQPPTPPEPTPTPTPPTPPTPIDNTVYVYGNKCHDDQDSSLCGEDCYNCHQSYPFEDASQWNSADAACRCLPDQRAPQGYTYSHTQHTNNQDGLCNGCGDCRLSWPADADATSPKLMYRCKPDQEDISYGPNCDNHYDMLCGADCHDCRESWPTNDPKKWYSDNAFCRCKAEEIREVVFGDSCLSLDSGKCGTHCRECNMSWEATDTTGATADCRCKRSW